jgi:succinate-acetate transporter protein
MTSLPAPSTALVTAPAQPFPNFIAPLLQNQTTVLAIVFGLFLAVWFVYTGIVFYHWVKYSHRLAISIPSLAVHVFISIGLFLLAASGFA